MASSSYYYSKYQDKKREVSKYKDWLSDLKDILNGFTAWAVTNGVKQFNNKLGDTVDNLEDAVKNVSRYKSNVNDISKEKEASVGSDKKLASAKQNVENEKSRVERLKRDAEDMRDYYYDQYLAAKRREAAEAARRAAEAAKG